MRLSPLLIAAAVCAVGGAAAALAQAPAQPEPPRAGPGAEASVVTAVGTATVKRPPDEATV